MGIQRIWDAQNRKGQYREFNSGILRLAFLEMTVAVAQLRLDGPLYNERLQVSK